MNRNQQQLHNDIRKIADSLEKIVKLTPTSKDDVLFDMILSPLFDKFRSK